MSRTFREVLSDVGGVARRKISDVDPHTVIDSALPVLIAAICATRYLAGCASSRGAFPGPGLWHNRHNCD